MAETDHLAIAEALETMHEDLIHRVVVALTAALPMIGISEQAEDRRMLHQHNMESTVHRFHAIVQNGITVDMRLVAAEYDWAGRKLATMGAHWEHQATLIALYFDEARRLRPWTAEELATLAQIQEQITRTARNAYNELTEA
jgi:hypothetical protein